MYRNNDSLSFGGARRAKEIIAAVLDAKKSGLVQAALRKLIAPLEAASIHAHSLQYHH